MGTHNTCTAQMGESPVSTGHGSIHDRDESALDGESDRKLPLRRETRGTSLISPRVHARQDPLPSPRQFASIDVVPTMVLGTNSPRARQLRCASGCSVQY